MGGLITRYALARMENEGEEHETGTYLSYDSPHNGAWIPVALQQLAYFFESVPDPSGNPKQAELIRSPAAQQLLWAWVENARDSGAVATWSKLRRDFLQDLKDVGWFPSKPGMRRIGVANGTGDTIGGPVQPDEEVFDWTRPGLARAVLRTQPAFGQMQEVVRMSAVLLGYRTSRTSEIPRWTARPAAPWPRTGCSPTRSAPRSTSGTARGASCPRSVPSPSSTTPSPGTSTSRPT